MASDKEYLDRILDGIENVYARAMMREYVLYYNGKVVGGIYDNRLLVKDVPSARKLMPTAEEQFPYDGAKAMLFVKNVEDKRFLQNLFEAMYGELSFPKKRR